MDHNKDKMEGKAKELGGKVQEKAGQWTGDRDLEAEGKGNQLEGKAQGMVGDVKEKAGELKDKMKDAV